MNFAPPAILNSMTRPFELRSFCLNILALLDDAFPRYKGEGAAGLFDGARAAEAVIRAANTLDFLMNIRII